MDDCLMIEEGGGGGGEEDDDPGLRFTLFAAGSVVVVIADLAQ